MVSFWYNSEESIQEVRRVRTNRRIFIALIAIVWCSLSPFSSARAAEDSRVLYDSYLSSYKSYQGAVGRNAPDAEVKKLLSGFNQARSAYERAVGTGATAPSQDDWSMNEVVAQPSMDSVGSAGLGQPASAVPASAASPKMPAALASILKDLWGENGRKVADKGIRNLERFISTNPTSSFVARAKYEMAKAYEFLKDDSVTSLKILKEISVDQRAGHLVDVAKQRIKYIEASRQYNQWKVNLGIARDTMENSYAKYRNTSFLAFPVKLFRWSSYAGKLLDFNDTQNKFEEFEITFEAAAAPFVPPVDIGFDLFQTAYDKNDENSDVRLVYDNNNAWYVRWKLLSEAKSSIDLQYFIVDEDVFGMALSGLLLRKAREGVKIRFMMDARGTKGFTRKMMGQDFMQELATFPNVEVKTFNPLNTNLATMLFDIRLIMASNHDKIIVIDDEYAVIGGRNISSHYFSNPIDLPIAYRDCDVVIKNPAVAHELDQAFMEEFTPLKQYEIGKGHIESVVKEMETAANAMESYMSGGVLYKPVKSDKKMLKALSVYNKELAAYKYLVKFDRFDTMEGAHEAPVKIIDKNSLFGPRDDVTDQIVRFIDGSRKEIIIQNPYVVLTERAEAALKRAARRGVRIIIHTNSPFSTDSLATQAMFYTDWKRILKEIPTSEIYVYYGQRKLHAKNFVFDGKIGIVGTYNMDYISEDVNSEVVAAVKSNEFGKELRDEIMSDVAQSKQYKIEVEADGSVKSVFGPDDLPGKRMWLMKLLSKLTFLKKAI